MLIISSKDFERMISNTNMEELQQYADECWKILHTPDCIFKVEDLSNNMPAYLVSSSEPPLVYVKYPTYMIQIFDEKNSTERTDQITLEKLLSSITNRSKVTLSKVDYIIENGQKKQMPFPYVNFVVCLGATLEENVACKENIIKILNNEGYSTSVSPTHCIRKTEVELLEDGKYFNLNYS